MGELPAQLQSYVAQRFKERVYKDPAVSKTAEYVVIAVAAAAAVAGIAVAVIAALITKSLVAVAGLAFFITVIIVAAVFGIPYTRRRQYKLAAFAEQNRLRFVLKTTNPTYPGQLFHVGSNRQCGEYFYTDEGLFAGAGRYSFVTGGSSATSGVSISIGSSSSSRDNTTTHRWNYAVFRLPVAVPHMVLDRLSNNGLFNSNLPFTIDRSQQLSFGAPFDQHFRVYAPGGYGRDAYYFFPPDVLATLMELPGGMDLEIVDNLIFCYWQHGTDIDNPQTWALIEHVQNRFAARLASLARRYRDDRAAQAAAPQPALQQPPAAWAGQVGQGTSPAVPAATGVAPTGARLKTKRFGISAMIGVGLLMVYFVLVVISKLLGGA